MKTYTVVGFYAENGQKFCDHVEADGPDDAEAKTKAVMDDDLQIVAVFEGALMACDTTGSIDFRLPFPSLSL